MNLNPFKNTYKIIEKTTLGGEKYYLIKYGNIFGRVFLGADIKTKLTWDTEEYGKIYGKFDSLQKVRDKINCHLEQLAKERLDKTFSRTINYV